MNSQNNFLSRTRQLIRRCSCCRSEGHNISQCNNPRLLNFQANIINRRDELREIYSIDANDKITYFETWLYGQDHHLIKSFAMRFCGAYSRNNLQLCVSKIISQIWGIEADGFGTILPTNDFIPLSVVPLSVVPLSRPMSIMDVELAPLDLNLAELLSILRNRYEEPNENRKFEIIPILCVETEELELEVKEECNICYEEKKNRNMVTLNCKHKFCGECVSQTLKKCNKFKLPNCAMCREKIDCIIINDNTILDTLKENLL